jgi:hypothetical protein
MKITSAGQVLVKNSCKEFHEDPTKRSVADTMSLTKGYGLYRRLFFYFVEITKKELVDCSVSTGMFIMIRM